MSEESTSSAGSDEITPTVERCQEIMAHAWMVRTFIKHSDEVEDFPELMGIVRAVFDTSRALETRVTEEPAYLKMLSKKIGKLEKRHRILPSMRRKRRAIRTFSRLSFL